MPLCHIALWHPPHCPAAGTPPAPMPASFQSIDYQVEGALAEQQAGPHSPCMHTATPHAWRACTQACGWGSPTPVRQPCALSCPHPPIPAATSGPSLTVQYFNTYKAAGVQSIMAAATGQPQDWIETSGTSPPSPAPAPARRRLLQAGNGRVLVLNKVRRVAGRKPLASCTAAGLGRLRPVLSPTSTPCLAPKLLCRPALFCAAAGARLRGAAAGRDLQFQRLAGRRLLPGAAAHLSAAPGAQHG